MQYLSVCSGIEAASVAWSPLGFEPLAFSEVDKFPSAVLAHHYPTVQNLGDMTLASQWSDYEPDILVGGTPCQSFSVAGLRKGLADPRGNLMLTYLAIADRYQPEWVVWENVPGVLSSGSGRDFGTFLGALGQIGYGWAYRVLDAQFFGVPQRRRRVFVVGYLGDWRRSAAVLFERHSLQGHPPPSREKRQDAASATGTRTFECGGIGSYSSSSSSSPLLKSGADLGHGCEALIHCADIAHATTTHQAKGGDPTTGNYVAHAFVDVGATLKGGSGARGYPDPSDGNGHNLVAHSLRGEGFDASEDGMGHGGGHQAVAFAQNTRDEVREMAVVGALASQPGMKQTSYIRNQMQVRRLTPRECERLQGFPDDYTLIPFTHGKPAADGPRYKALGNSMAVPVMRWIGERIQLVDWLHGND